MFRPALALMVCTALVIGCEQSKVTPAKTASAPVSSSASSMKKSAAAPAKPAMSSMKKSASASDEFLTAKAIRSLLSGATMKFVNSRTGNPTEIQYKPDGSFSGSGSAGTRVFYFDGSWSVKEPNIYCFKTPRREGCRNMKNVGGIDYQTIDLETGNVVGNMTITK